MPIQPGRHHRECGFCGESSWAGRGDLARNFLCEPWVKKAEVLIADERRAERGWAECGKAINRDDKVYATWKSLRGILL